MLSKRYGLDRGFQRSPPALPFRNSELLQSDFYNWTTHETKLGSFVGTYDILVS